MKLSLNCLVLGQTSDLIFTQYIGEESKIDGIQVKFDQLTVSGFKKLLLREEQLKGITNMDLYKVELSLSSLKNKIYKINEIKDLGVIMESMYEFKEYLNDNLGSYATSKTEILKIKDSKT